MLIVILKNDHRSSHEYDMLYVSVYIKECIGLK